VAERKGDASRQTLSDFSILMTQDRSASYRLLGELASFDRLNDAFEEKTKR